MSFQTVLHNHTPFAAEKFVLVDPDGQEVVLVVVVATFETLLSGLVLAENQLAPIVEDIYAGDPANSSLLFENELAINKPMVDVVVIGSAYAPGGRPSGRVPVELRLGDVRKALWVSGHRAWAQSVFSRPVPFTKMEIRYEGAYGGTNPRSGAGFGPNPVGVGFQGAVSQNDVKTAVPNVEYADSMIDSPSAQLRPAGLGPIARYWQPRVQFAGTCDEDWQASRSPLLPADFDPRFNQIAPPDQQSATIRGGEPARLTNLTPEGVWEFRLPRLHVPVHLIYDSRHDEADVRLDTVVIEPDLRRLRLTARLSKTTVRGPDALRAIVLGHMTQGWRRALRARKRYLDFRGSGGADPSIPAYTL